MKYSLRELEIRSANEMPAGMRDLFYFILRVSEVFHDCEAIISSTEGAFHHFYCLAGGFFRKPPHFSLYKRILLYYTVRE